MENDGYIESNATDAQNIKTQVSTTFRNFLLRKLSETSYDIPVVSGTELVVVDGLSVLSLSVLSGLGDGQFRLRTECVTPGA